MCLVIQTVFYLSAQVTRSQPYVLLFSSVQIMPKVKYILTGVKPFDECIFLNCPVNIKSDRASAEEVQCGFKGLKYWVQGTKELGSRY